MENSRAAKTAWCTPNGIGTSFIFWKGATSGKWRAAPFVVERRGGSPWIYKAHNDKSKLEVAPPLAQKLEEYASRNRRCNPLMGVSEFEEWLTEKSSFLPDSEAGSLENPKIKAAFDKKFLSFLAELNRAHS